MPPLDPKATYNRTQHWGNYELSTLLLAAATAGLGTAQYDICPNPDNGLSFSNHSYI